MRAPWYRDLPADELPRFALAGGASVTDIAGASHGVAGAVQREHTEPLYLDVTLPAGATFAQPLPETHNAFVYVYRGQARIEGRDVPAGRMAILANERDADGVRLVGAEDTRLLILAGRPLAEPIAQYGPFVMNTQAELAQAVEDYRAGRFTH
jgi:redox-sensitive bicupin YhaK (pirin superfamily)